MTKKQLMKRYADFCQERGIAFSYSPSVAPYDDSTLFCPAGMQKYKVDFANKNYRATVANVQECLRVDDLEEVGDGTHFLHFAMMGLFSFRQLTVEQTIEFWRDFLSEIGITPTHYTVHPDKLAEWRDYYRPGDDVRTDLECIWTDGTQGGYCTEFYVGDLEIGNIVNTGGDCIDVGFGLDRLLMVLGSPPSSDEQTVLKGAILAIAGSGYEPGPKLQGYVLRKLLRRLWSLGGKLDHPYFRAEIERQATLGQLYMKLLPKHPDKDAAWWYDTHGIEVEEQS